VNTTSGRTYNIPKTLLEIHAYHPDRHKLIDFQIKANFAGMGKSEGLKGKLLVRQQGKCELCRQSLFHYPDGSEIGFISYEIDHIVPISEGGSKTVQKNMRLLHK